MDTFTPQRAAAIRESLITVVAEQSPTRSRRAVWAALLVVGGVVVGAGGTAGAFAATGALTPTHPQSQSSSAYPDAVPAPPGVSPGSMLVSELGTPFTVEIDGAAEVPLPDAPFGATHLRATVTPTTPGTLTMGLDADGNNTTMSASASDISGGSAAASMSYPVDESEGVLYLQADGMTGSVTVQWTVEVPTELGINANGQTFGVMGAPVGVPELVLVSVETVDGSLVDGYARAADLGASSPDHAGHPSSPEQALEWQAEAEAAYPDGWDVPVFESDGETQIGVLRIRG